MGANAFLRVSHNVEGKQNRKSKVAALESVPILLKRWDSIISTFVRFRLSLLHSEKPKLFTILAFLSAVGLNILHYMKM